MSDTHVTAVDLDTEGAANFIRSELAHALRSHPYQVDMILAGYDDKIGYVYCDLY